MSLGYISDIMFNRITKPVPKPTKLVNKLEPLIMIRPFLFLVYGPANVIIWQIETKKENLCFLYPPVIMFTFIMNCRNNIKINKKSVLIPRYNHKFI